MPNPELPPPRPAPYSGAAAGPDYPDYQLAFDLAPVGMVLSRDRKIIDCNQQLCTMFGTSRPQLLGQSFLTLYPSADEYERTGARIAPILNRNGTYADNRIMKRVGGRYAGETFWCHVTGRALQPDAPHAAGIWCFEDLSAERPVRAGLTAREREIAACLMQALTSKQIAKMLAISHRTVETHRARLMGKYQSHTTADLVHKLSVG